MITDRLQQLLDKDEIRDLALLYARGVDRKDTGLLRSLYTTDGIDNHGTVFRGSAHGYIDFLEETFAFITIGAHYICNHLIEVNGDEAFGEVYAIGYHLIPAPDDAATHSIVGVRYLDQYRRENEHWRFARRDVIFDLDLDLPARQSRSSTTPPEGDASYELLRSKLFRRPPTAS